MSWSRLGDLDRRWIWLLMFILLAGVMLNPIGLPIKVTPPAEQVYNYIEQNIQAGDVVWVAHEYEGGSTAELNPEVVAVTRHLFQKGAKIVYSSVFGPTAPSIVNNIITPVAEELGKVYGEDYIILGYKPGTNSAIRGFTQDISATSAGVDWKGDSLDQFPIMQGLTRIAPDQVKLIVAVETGTPGCPQWLQFGATPSGVPLLCGTLSMSIAESKPYVESGQYVALIEGVRGAAEYEQILGYAGMGSAAQDAQSLSGLYVVLMIVLGNIAYLASRREAAQ